MSVKKMVKFECRQCGGHELGYQKYVKCLTPVTNKDDGQMEYGLSEIDEDDYLYTDNCFICMNCKGAVEHCGYRFETENQLITYLTMDENIRLQQEKDYKAYIEAQIAEEREEWDLIDFLDQEIDEIDTTVEI